MIWLVAQHDWISSWYTVLTQVSSLSPLLYCITHLNVSSTCSSNQAPETNGLADSSEKHYSTKLEGFVGDWIELPVTAKLGLQLTISSVQTDPYCTDADSEYIRFLIFLFFPP